MNEQQHERISKDEAIRRLRNAGYAEIANELEKWRDTNGNNWGWDGWIRGAYPVVIDVIWHQQPPKSPPR